MDRVFSRPVRSHIEETRSGRAGLSLGLPEFVLWQLISPVLIAILVSTRQLEAAGFAGAALFTVLALNKLKEALAWRPSQGPAVLIDLLLALLGLVLSLVYLVILGHPQQSILYRLNFGGYDVTRSLPSSFAVIVACIFVACIKLPAPVREEPLNTWKSFRPATALLLAILGSIGLLTVLATSRVDAFQQRDSGGSGGLVTFAYWGASAFVVYTVVGWRKGRSAVFVLLALLVTGGLLFSGNRSPIALIGLAVVVRLLSERKVRTVLVTVACLPVGLLVFAYQSVWRGLVARAMPSDPGSVLSVIFADPSAALVRLGIDSIDGHALTVDLLRQGFLPRPWDLATAVLNFVPRAIWDSKPTLLGGEIGRMYLGTTGSGIFLSGPGYLSLVTGSTFAGALSFVAIIVILKLLVRRPRHAFFVVVAAYLAARFTIAGDAFDVFLAIQLLVIIGVAEAIGSKISTRAIPGEAS